MLLGERRSPSVEEIADARLVELAVGRSADVRQRAAVPRTCSEAHRRAAERAYAPGGAGYNEAAASFANAASAEAAPAASPTSRKRKA